MNLNKSQTKNSVYKKLPLYKKINKFSFYYCFLSQKEDNNIFKNDYNLKFIKTVLRGINLHIYIYIYI